MFICHDQVGFIGGIHGWFNNRCYNINVIKDKNLMILSIDLKRAFKKIHNNNTQ